VCSRLDSGKCKQATVTLHVLLAGHPESKAGSSGGARKPSDDDPQGTQSNNETAASRTKGGKPSASAAAGAKWRPARGPASRAGTPQRLKAPLLQGAPLSEAPPLTAAVQQQPTSATVPQPPGVASELEGGLGRPAAAEEVPWSLGSTAAVMLAWVVSSIAVSVASVQLEPSLLGLLAPIDPGILPASEETLDTLDLFLLEVMDVAVLGVVLGAALRRYPSLGSFFPLSWQSWQTWVRPLALWGGLALVALWPDILDLAVGAAAGELALPSQGWVVFPLELASTAVLAPIYEELVFRGFLLQSLKKCLPQWASLLTSTLLFRLGHENANPVDFVFDFVTDLPLGIVCLTTKSLWPSIFLHGFWNGTLVLSKDLLPPLPEDYWFLSYLYD
jgi:membrane protease YdiL (CAAX protease family)